MKDLVIFTLLTVAASAQCPDPAGKPPATPLVYPKTSDRYAVQYQIGNTGTWTTAQVYISYYGMTNASPYRAESGYTLGTESMSFVSIPARANASVQLRVTKLFGSAFKASDQVSVRPTVKLRDVTTGSDGTVTISTFTGSSFNGEQYILWWNRGSDGGGVEALAFFLNPPYTEPAGGNVKIVSKPSDLTGDLSAFDTLDFEGTVAIGSTGAVAFSVPANIQNIFLGSGAWVQGKLAFPASSATRKIYGPGVLDGSRFNYQNRNCTTDDGIYSLSSLASSGVLNHFTIDGIIIADHNHAANDALFNGTVNNVKTISWNGENAALRFQDSTVATNIFVRSGDDSLMVWGNDVKVSNATIWQNYNGGVVNIGWLNNSPGDGVLVDGLYVVKTDWLVPTAPSWTALSQPGPPSPLAGGNNAVIASLQVPTTAYGQVSAPVFKNIFVEDPPLVLFSLKIVPPVNCPATGPLCTAASIKQSSAMSLNIENLFSPASIAENSIGFETLPAGYTTISGEVFSAPYTLTGKIHVAMTNVVIAQPNGFVLPLSSLNAASAGKVSMNGTGVSTKYNVVLPVFHFDPK